MALDPNDPRIEEGILLFNQQEYFACHDVFEDLWSELSGSDKTFVQGLIHAAVCLFHFEGHNLSGARKMYSTFCVYTNSADDDFCGIDVSRLKQDMENCFAELLQVKSGYPAHIQLDPDQLPRIYRTGSSV